MNVQRSFAELIILPGVGNIANLVADNQLGHVISNG